MSVENGHVWELRDGSLVTERALLLDPDFDSMPRGSQQFGTVQATNANGAPGITADCTPLSNRREYQL